ncbi:MAG: type 1 glutamine amidotransferase [Bdellovibrionales bacterium]|nr:type 1 glutamine amidotransferase [Bdellovibrionales bacterium]
MAQRPSSQSPILIVQHAPHEHAAALRRALDSQGIPSHVAQIWSGDTLPSPSEIGGLVSLGGPMGANDEIDHAWILDELRLMKKTYDLGLPIAGICLGGQMLARALGGKVAANEHPEIGWFEIHLNDAGKEDPLMCAAGPTPRFYQWHYDTFLPPPGATSLASSPICAHQAYRAGERAYGFQFHPEADSQLVDEWLQVEGTDEEILLARIAHHQACVQTPSEHLENARSGEEFSLRFVAAISQLFQKEAYSPVESDLLAKCEEMRERATQAILQFYGPHGEIAPIAGRIERVVDIPKGKFLFLRETSGLMWPVRLDHIHSLEKLKG